MKLILLALASLPALADPRIDTMVANCSRVMEQNVCRVTFDRKEYKSDTILFAGFGRVSTDAYIEMRNSGAEMCNWARTACQTNWDGDKCKVVRASWRQR